MSYNRGKYSPEDYLTYMAKNLLYMQSPTFTSFGSTTTSGKPWVTLAPKHLDICKRETYTLTWHKDGESGNWEHEGLSSDLEKRRMEGGHVYTSSIASFAQAPTD